MTRDKGALYCCHARLIIQESSREQTGAEEIHAGGEERQPERGDQPAV